MRTPTLLASLALSLAAWAGTPPTPAMLENLSRAPAGFEENKGQVRTTSGEPAPFVRYRLSQGNTQLFLLGNGIAYQFTRMHYPEGYAELVAGSHQEPKRQEQLDAMRDEVRLETFRMDMVLEGADHNARITTEGRSSDYAQYYNHDALDVRTYAKVTYHDIYPGIDWVVYTTEKGMKYDFVVRPGADPDRIRMRFEHHEELSLDANGNLTHGNRMGRFTEDRPVSFQDGKEIDTRFVLEDDALRFAIGNYDRNGTLIIDPARMWGTYYGGNSNDFGLACTTDGNGNIYLAGSTGSTSAIAAGGHQNTLGGLTDAFLVKFTSGGSRLWATYYGGEGGDEARGCAIDGSGNICIAGTTSSESGIASGGHQDIYADGLGDAFLVKFSPVGNLLWGTYYGGDDREWGYSCSIDASGNVFLAGITYSTTGIASDGHQNTFGGGEPGLIGDAFLVKFNGDGTRLWGTYYGGTVFDVGHSCAVDEDGNVFLAGATSSDNGIASGGHQNVSADQGDAFLAKFAPDGSRLWGTYYGGNGFDMGYACTVDASGNVFLAGHTMSSDAIAEGGHQNTPGGGAQQDAFLVKFNSNGLRQWGTYYGGTNQDEGRACAVDDDANVYLAGWTRSTTGIAQDGHQNTIGGSWDAFLVKFNASGTRQWGTYYGSGAIYDDRAYSCTVDDNGDVYMSGETGSPTAIADGGHQNTHGGSQWDGFLAKFEGSVPEPDCSTTGALQEIEPNNGYGAATVLPSNTAISGSLGACSPTDNSIDYFRIDPSIQGVMRVDACLSSSGTVPLDVTFRVRVSSGTVLATYNLPAGANDAAITSFFEFPCQGIGAYVITVEVPGITDCLSYAFSYTMITPVFNNDPFPTPGVAHDTYQDGQNGFYYEESTTDLYNIVPPFNGLMTIEVQAEHAAPTAGTMEVRLYNTAGIVMEEWIMPVGANGVPDTTLVTIGCLGNSTDYDVRFNAIDCGISYRWKYTMSPPVFAPDPEGPTVAVAYDTFQDGQVGFVNDNSDTYSTTPALQGVMHFEIQAEHSGAGPGSMEFRFQYSGVPIAIQNIPVGANGVPVTTTVSVPCRGASVHTVVFEDPVACGVSYRWRYYTTAPFFQIDAEPNNSTASAIVLSPNTEATGHLDFLTGVDNGGENTDFYRIDLPTDGVLHVNVEAEHVDGSSTESLETVIVMSTGTVLATWDAPVGANSTPSGSSFSLPCRGATVPYYLRLISNTCGVSYRVSWSVTPAFFSADAEPNNSYSAGITMDLSDAWHDGHIGFYNTTDDDFYKFTHAGGPYSVTVSAEHAGTGDGTMELAIVNSAGSVFGTFVVPVGGSSTPLTNTFTQATLAAGSLYALRLRDVTCGVSYRLHCANDIDNDGVCDVADLCPGGPEPGTPCDDGNALTLNDAINDDCLCEGDISTGIPASDVANAVLRIWPNPAADEVWIDIGEASTAPATVIVRDMLGRAITTLGPINSSASGLYVVQLGALAQGTYILDLKVGGKQWSRRIVKA
ncbi:MAG: T9SS type A sorting domain-containing protein [Flavobacteriales bacterium]|nr:T9SS type A sorting domain-containing protein [Flavobacteriales bacterium]